MGDFGVGKSSLIVARESLKYLQLYTEDHSPLNVRLSINDIGNAHHPQEIDNLLLDNIDGIILCCDLTKEDTFYSFDLWLDSIKNLPRLNSIVMVGNKLDIAQRDREVDISDLQDYSKKLKALSFATSAKTAEGVDEVFTSIVKQCLESEYGSSISGGTSPRQGGSPAQFGPSRTVAGGVMGPSSAPTPARQTLNQAQRTLMELRAQHSKQIIPRGGSEFFDSAGDIQLKYGGYCYLIKEEHPDRSFEAFAKLVQDEEYQGLCIARKFPDEIRDEYDFGSTPIYWLTRSGTEQYHLSVNLSKLSSFIKSFLDKTPKPVLMIEGMEYLIIQNDFMSVLKFIQLISEFVRMKRACFVVPINPGVLEARDISLMEREMTTINV
jgi:hypothetical protein